MRLSDIMGLAGDKPGRGRPRAEDIPKLRVIREAAVCLLEREDVDAKAIEIADAFGVSPRTLRRWARDKAQSA